MHKCTSSANFLYSHAAAERNLTPQECATQAETSSLKQICMRNHLWNFRQKKTHLTKVSQTKCKIFNLAPQECVEDTSRNFKPKANMYAKSLVEFHAKKQFEKVSQIIFKSFCLCHAFLRYQISFYGRVNVQKIC